MTPTVLLLNSSWWPCSAHVAIALKATGMRVAAAYPRRGHPLGKTDSVDRRYVYAPLSPLASIHKAIERSDADWIVACDDRAVMHLHQLHAVARDAGDIAVAELIERSLGDPRGYVTTSSRADLLKAADDAGIPTPSSYRIDDLEGLARVAARELFPLVIKADGSWGGLGVRIVHDKEQARAAYAAMARPLGLLPALKRMIANRDAFSIEAWRKHSIPSITVQSFIEGRPANCVAFCREGKVLACIAVEVVAAQSRYGPATKVRLVPGEAMRSAAEALASRLHLSGFFGFDFMLHAESATPYLVEMNARCAMPCHLAVQNGDDLIAALASELQGRRVARRGSLRIGDVISYFPQAWLAAPADEGLRAGFHDVPWGEPRLVKELLRRPWPDRSLLARLSDRIRGMTLEQRASHVLNFDDGLHGRNAPVSSSWDTLSEPT